MARVHVPGGPVRTENCLFLMVLGRRRVGRGWGWAGPQSAGGKPESAEGGPLLGRGAKSCLPAEGFPVLQRSAPRDQPHTPPPPVCLHSPQSPPKLNEVSPDANRENTVAESGSESSSQEATPEKGRPRSCPLPEGLREAGRDGDAVDHPWPQPTAVRAGVQ